MVSPLHKDDEMTPFEEFPWQKPSPVETRISTGFVEETSGDESPLDVSRIRVKVRHEISGSNLKLEDCIEVARSCVRTGLRTSGV
jgi:hypothetical protein